MDQDQDFHTVGLEYEPSYLSSYSFRDQYAPMRSGQWVVVLIICMIPGIDLLFLLFWALAGSINKNLQNFSRAVLLLMGSMALLFGVTAGVFRMMGKAFLI